MNSIKNVRRRIRDAAREKQLKLMALGSDLTSMVNGSRKAKMAYGAEELNEPEEDDVARLG